jgi:hypothetical protein
MLQAAPETLQIKRSDGTTVEATIITRGRRGRERREARFFEPVVGPSGDVIAAEVNTTLDKPGLRFVVKAHGKLILTEHAERLGYTFYRDMCLVGIPSEKVEPSPIHWAIYEKVSALKAKNQVPKTPIPPAKLYHPEVVRRRSQSQDGVRRIDDAEMQAILDRITLEDTEEDVKRARAAGLVVPEPESDRSLEALLAEAAGD